MKVEILGYKKHITGVIGVNPEHFNQCKEKVEFEDLYIDCGASSKEEMEQYVRFGDFVVYKREPELLLNENISGRGLDNKTGAFIVAGAGITPNMAIICDVTFATDHPGINIDKHGKVHLGGGPVLGIGPAINSKINGMLEKAAERLKIKLQYELYTNTTGTDGDRIRYTGKGVPIALVSLPLRYMHSPVETGNYNDIREEINLLSEFILHLTGEENLKPVEL